MKAEARREHDERLKEIQLNIRKINRVLKRIEIRRNLGSDLFSEIIRIKFNENGRVVIVHREEEDLNKYKFTLEELDIWFVKLASTISKLYHDQGLAVIEPIKSFCVEKEIMINSSREISVKLFTKWGEKKDNDISEAITVQTIIRIGIWAYRNLSDIKYVYEHKLITNILKSLSGIDLNMKALEEYIINLRNKFDIEV